jgi:hypothetical protein
MMDDDDYFLMAKKQKTENKSRIASLPMVSVPVLFSAEASVSDTYGPFCSSIIENPKSISQNKKNKS